MESAVAFQAPPTRRNHSLWAQWVMQAAENTPVCDPLLANEFRANVLQLAQKLPALCVEVDDIAQHQLILDEFSRYHRHAEEVQREQLLGWRDLVSRLLAELLARTGIDPASANAATLTRRVSTLFTREELHAFKAQLAEFLRVSGIDSPALQSSAYSSMKETGAQTSNDNAAGLPNSAVAVNSVKHIIEQGGQGCVAVFRLHKLDTIEDRFGETAVEDCLMSISAFLTNSLRSDDAIYYWNNSVLLAILKNTATLKVLTEVLQRIVDNNRDITIQVGGRVTMLRIPLSFELIPISQLKDAEELYTLVPL